MGSYDLSLPRLWLARNGFVQISFPKRCCHGWVRGRPPRSSGQISKNFVYTIDVSEHLLRGESVTDEQIQAWADEAEAGYDLASLPKARRGRPPVGDGPGVVVPVRLDAATLAALTARAEAEGIQNRSEAIRAAVKAWVDVA